MWGSWYGVLTAGIVAGILLLAGALTAWTPLFAFAIAGLVIAGFAVYFALKGGREEVSATHSDDPEHAPKRQGSEVTGGVWGEKREA